MAGKTTSSQRCSICGNEHSAVAEGGWKHCNRIIELEARVAILERNHLTPEEARSIVNVYASADTSGHLKHHMQGMAKLIKIATRKKAKPLL